MFCSERRQPAEKLIADRNNCSEEGAAEFSVGFLMVGGQRGLFLFHPQHGKHALMLSQVPMSDSAIRFFYEIRTLDAPPPQKVKAKTTHPLPPRDRTQTSGQPDCHAHENAKPTLATVRPCRNCSAHLPTRRHTPHAASPTVGNSAAQPAPRCPKPMDTARVQLITYL